MKTTVPNWRTDRSERLRTGQDIGPMPPGPDDAPELSVGDSVRIRHKPESVRKVMRVVWHSHRHEYVYVVECSGATGDRGYPFEPYWFFDQLEVLDKERMSVQENA